MSESNSNLLIINALNFHINSGAKNIVSIIFKSGLIFIWIMPRFANANANTYAHAYRCNPSTDGLSCSLFLKCKMDRERERAGTVVEVQLLQNYTMKTWCKQTCMGLKYSKSKSYTILLFHCISFAVILISHRIYQVLYRNWELRHENIACIHHAKRIHQVVCKCFFHLPLIRTILD